MYLVGLQNDSARQLSRPELPELEIGTLNVEMGTELT